MHDILRQRGFTLIELMIALVILAIVTAVALPAYTNQVVKSRRSDCMGTLLGFAQAMEKQYALDYTYAGNAAGGGDTGAPANTVFPDQCPTQGDTAYYNLTIQAADADSYTLRATPVSGSSQDGDGMLELTSVGQRRWDKNNDGDTADSGENNWET